MFKNWPRLFWTLSLSKFHGTHCSLVTIPAQTIICLKINQDYSFWTLYLSVMELTGIMVLVTIPAQTTTCLKIDHDYFELCLFHETHHSLVTTDNSSSMQTTVCLKIDQDYFWICLSKISIHWQQPVLTNLYKPQYI